jgi:hypothetical protein
VRYRRDVPREDLVGLAAEVEHIRDHLASVAHPDDDPQPWRGQVIVTLSDHVDGDALLVSVTGELDAEPDAPYLRPGYDPDLDDDGTRFTPYREDT